MRITTDILAECQPYSCSALYDYLIANNTVFAYYPMGTAGAGIPDFTSPTGTIPEVTGNSENLTIQSGYEGFFIVDDGIMGSDACVGSKSVRIDPDPIDAKSVTTLAPHRFEEQFGEAALGNGAYLSMVILPRGATGADEIFRYTATFATAGYSGGGGTGIIPEISLNRGITMGLGNGSTGTLRSLLITTATSGTPNNGPGNLVLDDVFDINGTEPVLLTMAYRLEPTFFEDGATLNEPAWRAHLFARADYRDGTSVSDSRTVWSVFGFPAFWNPEDWNPLTRVLTPVTTPTGNPITFLMRATWFHPFMADIVLHDGTDMDNIALRFRRSFSTYQVPGYC